MSEHTDMGGGVTSAAVGREWREKKVCDRARQQKNDCHTDILLLYRELCAFVTKRD